MSEIPLAGGDVNPVVRVGETVRRPRGPEAVRALLEWYERLGFDGAPRFIGFDEQGARFPPSSNLRWLEEHRGQLARFLA